MGTIGTVRSVTITDTGEIRVTVPESPSREQREIPFRTFAPGVWAVPSKGDVVEITELNDGTRIAHSPKNVPDFGAPSGLSEGDIAFRLNKDTVLKFIRNSDGSYDVDLNCDAELHLLGKDIYVGDKNNTKKVLTEDAVFEYEQRIDTSDGTGGTQTQTTTTVSNGEVTDTEVE